MEPTNRDEDDADWGEFTRQIAAGESNAQVEVVNQFTERLLRLVDRRLSPALARRLDPEDVVQSVFRSFFRRSDEFSFKRSGDLWRLLATMAVNKVRKQAARQQAAKRDYRCEQFVNPEGSGETSRLELLFKNAPTPDQLVAFEETLETLTAEFTPLQRRIFQMRLDGDSLTKISAELQKSQRTVRRILQSIRTMMLEQLFDRRDP